MWRGLVGPANLVQPAVGLRRTENGEFFVANIKSQIKRNKQNIVARDRNKAVKSEIRTRTKSAVVAVGTENEETALRNAIKRIDTAAAKGVIHKNRPLIRRAVCSGASTCSSSTASAGPSGPGAPPALR